MKLIWVSDIHLNFLSEDERQDFYSKLEGDVILITGDIAESKSVIKYLKEICDNTKIPIVFVLGNHDYYGSNIASVKRSTKPFGYLSRIPYIDLNGSTALIGVDGWGDCRNGDFDHNRMTMSDWIHIKDIKTEYLKGHEQLKVKLQALADKDARLLKRKVLNVLKEGFTKIIIATHVPPFKEACLHNGAKSTDSGLLFFSSKILGDTILPIAKKNPKVDFLWLSGHTHSRAKYKPCNNMTVKVAKSEYYYPQIEEIINA